MSTISTEQVKKLRAVTGVSIMQCKKALEEAEGDMEKAKIILERQSKAVALKKSDRSLGAGVVASYIHTTGTVGSLVELSCETDFVAKNTEFKTLAYEIAMHVAASAPDFLRREEVDENAKAKAMEVFQKEVEGKPEAMKAKILEGKLASYFSEKTLLEQKYIKNQDVTIQQLLDQAVQKFGEKTEVTRFVRFAI